MAAVTVYLVNQASVDDALMNNVCVVLNGYFQRCVEGTDTTFSMTKTIKDKTAYNGTAVDLLVYVQPSFAKSVLKKIDPALTNGSGAGNTVFSPREHPNLAGSEVYLDVIKKNTSDLTRGLANLIFHECMHNKANLGDQLHREGGEGLAKESVSASDTLTDANASYMQARMGYETTQWDQGFTAKK